MLVTLRSYNQSKHYKSYFYSADLGQSSTGSDGLISSAMSSESSNSSLEDLQNSLKVVCNLDHAVLYFQGSSHRTVIKFWHWWKI